MESSPVQLGALTLDTPVMLAPMAGVTNPPFRQLCREAGEAGLKAAGYAWGDRADLLGGSDRTGPHAPAGLWVCEMVTTRALVERNAETMNMIKPDPGDPVRSIQLYGVEPKTTAEAVRILVGENRADHIDLNFGCPAPKVTRKGGGSALPWKLDLFEELTRAAVRASEEASKDRGFTVPITAKVRIGVDDQHTTFVDAARIAEDAGIVGLTLHARTTAQHYSGHAHWERIGELVQATDLPVLGNGDVFEVSDVQRIMEQTGCAGVAVGRGCQGRPWLFHDMAAFYHGSNERARPWLSEVADVIVRHAELSIEHFNGDEHRALRELRKHMAWYLRGFAVGGEARNALALVSTLAELKERLGGLEDQPYPDAAEGARGRAGNPKQPHLPEGWLDSRELNEAQRAKIALAEVNVSGG
ncbi:MAG: tRNA dihydrouridine synthase DusB [Ancrocorticia sp.]|uniref:tRNA dihydrouridine synthase DusB n=1 Tax=Ancrocorticia sp. TaxID=2593684 RepID=UPI003F8ECACC